MVGSFSFFMIRSKFEKLAIVVLGLMVLVLFVLTILISVKKSKLSEIEKEEESKTAEYRKKLIEENHQISRLQEEQFPRRVEGNVIKTKFVVEKEKEIRKIKNSPNFNGNLGLKEKVGKDYYLIGNLEKAEKSFLEISKNVNGVGKEDRSMAYKMLGRIYYEKKEPDKATKYWVKSIAENPRDNPAYIDLANFYFFHGKRAEAITLLKGAIIQNPGNINYYLRLADFYWYLGKKEKASSYYQKVLRLDPDNSVAHNALSTLNRK